MNIIDFLPSYPNINNNEYDNLNLYDDTKFAENIYKKKEFYDNKLDVVEILPKEVGVLTKHQNTIARFMSSRTSYTGVLLVHQMGTGKTCAAVGAVEQIRRENSTIDGAIIFASGDKMLDNFKREIALKCTTGEYLPTNYNKLTEKTQTVRINKLVSSFYDTKNKSFTKFSTNVIDKFDNSIIKNLYSNKVIIIDEVHNLRIQDKDTNSREDSKRYYNFHKFLHLVENCKIILLSGTPMKDTPEEIASVMNLILPLNQQLPLGNDFKEKYMEKVGDKLMVKPTMKEDLKSYFKGRVSYLAAMETDIKKEYVKKGSQGTLQNFRVASYKMQHFQNLSYEKATTQDNIRKIKTKEKKNVIKETSGSGWKNNAREASLFVYPDGTWGKEGFDKYIGASSTTISGDKYHLTKDFLNESKISQISKNTQGYSTKVLKIINNYSSKYANILANILKSKQKSWFIYGSIVHGSGLILFSLLLELFGFTLATGQEKTQSNRYCLLTGQNMTVRQLKRIQNRFNNNNNATGKFIRVVIASEAISEGFSFYNVQREVILTPHWNFSETSQALARGLRLGSHRELVRRDIVPEMKIYLTASVPTTEPSVDLHLYKMSEDKDVSIMSIIRLIMEASFDCALNYLRNYRVGNNNQRDCNYMECEYKCDGVDMNIVKNGMDVKNIDNSTYQLYYINPMRNIYRKIEQLLYINNSMSLDSLTGYLQERGYSKRDVITSLQTLVDRSDQEILYEDFISVYSQSNYEKIKNGIRNIFRQHFVIGIPKIQEQLQKYSLFEIITVLKNIINQSIPIKNMYGFVSYLKEKNNIYYLIDDISIKSSILSAHYTKFPNITVGKTFNNLIEQINKNKLPSIISNMFKQTEISKLSKLIYSIPFLDQEKLLEMAVISENNEIEKNKDVRKMILEVLSSYISNDKNTIISSLLYRYHQKLRCIKITQNMEYKNWYDCDEKFYGIFKDIKESEIQELRDKNTTGIFGKINRQTGAFCMIDSRNEKKRQQKNSTRFKATTQHSGSVCKAGGWNNTQRLDIIFNRLKLSCPVDYEAKKNKNELVKQLSNSKLPITYTTEDLNTFSIPDLRRLSYWGIEMKKADKYCNSIQKWFEDNGFLEDDANCGTSFKKTTDKSTVVKTFDTDQFLINQVDTTIKKDVKEINKIVGNWYSIQNYEIPIDSKTQWYIVKYKKPKNKFSKVVFVADVSQDRKYITNVSFSDFKNRNRNDILKTAVESLVKYTGIEFISLNRSIKKYKSILKEYKQINLDIIRTEGNNDILKLV